MPVTRADASFSILFVVDYHKKLNAVAPLLFILGNHDYAYDHTDNRRYTDANVLRMLGYFVDNVNSMANVSDLDLAVAPVTGGTRYRGSLAYAVEHGDYVFLMLHWGAALKTGSFTRDIAGKDPKSGQNRFYEITSVVPWLGSAASAADARGKHIVLVPHSKRALATLLKKESALAAQLGSFDVVDVLSGHDHDAWGMQPAPISIGAKSVPVVYGGSLSYQTMVALQFGADGVVSAQAYDSAKGKDCSKTEPDDEN